MNRVLLRTLNTILAVLSLGVSMNANAWIFGPAGYSWKEEVLLHDGKKIIVERTVQRGGRHEVGQQPSIREQRLAFNMPGTGQRISWEDPFSKDIGSANFLPMMLEVYNAVAYLVVYPMGCLSYNKWGRPNPPYVVLKNNGKSWNRIALQELPAELKKPNLIFSSPDDEARNQGTPVISAETISALYASVRQPEYRNILREPLTKQQINEMCMEMILYKGYWIMPNDPVGRRIADTNSK